MRQQGHDLVNVAKERQAAEEEEEEEEEEGGRKKKEDEESETHEARGKKAIAGGRLPSIQPTWACWLSCSSASFASRWVAAASGGELQQHSQALCSIETMQKHCLRCCLGDKANMDPLTGYMPFVLMMTHFGSGQYGAAGIMGRGLFTASTSCRPCHLRTCIWRAACYLAGVSCI